MVGHEPDVSASRSKAEREIDEAYHEYLWGDISPRTFARRARARSATSENSRNKVIQVELDANLDLTRFVPR